MSMTTAAMAYFERTAEQWDTLRAGYFTEAVRATAIAKAYLRPEMTVADVGAGTGFMAAGLAPLVHEVHVLDGSAAMLAVARRNLAAFSNVIFHEADGQALPLPDGSLDAVFANMYLHHCSDPAAAIREMTRLLKPGGRLVITDLDAHPYTWLRDEMADVWQGFERPQVADWFRAAGLVNVLVDCTGQSCCATAQLSMVTDEAGRTAQIGVFVAVGTRRVTGAREAVAAGYGMLALSGCSCSTACCDNNAAAVAQQIGYAWEQLQAVPAGAADFSLGCGNPTALAALQPGETVLDIGSGGGLDVFIAARQVGAQGHVIGVDMTPAMVERATRAAQTAQLTNVEFRLGQAEALPVADGVINVILSNCVINLCEDKGRAFAEAHRVLQAGGRLVVSDVVTGGALPAALRADPAGWPDCIHGALPEQEYLDLIAQAGFTDITTARGIAGGTVSDVPVYSLYVTAYKNAGKCCPPSAPAAGGCCSAP